MNTQTLASRHLNAYVMYGGMPVRRVDVIRHLREQRVDEHSIGYFTLKPDVTVSDPQAADAEWARILRIEALEAEGMTFSDAQAALMAQEMA